MNNTYVKTLGFAIEQVLLGIGLLFVAAFTAIVWGLATFYLYLLGHAWVAVPLTAENALGLFVMTGAVVALYVIGWKFAAGFWHDTA